MRVPGERAFDDQVPHAVSTVVQAARGDGCADAMRSGIEVSMALFM
jgi:hypothetical protein